MHNKAESGFGLLARATELSEKRVVHPSTNVAHCCLTSMRGQALLYYATIHQGPEGKKKRDKKN